MVLPRKSVSDEVDLSCLNGSIVKSPDPCPQPIACNDPPVPARRYHSVQLAIVTGLFAFGGFLCSLFFVDAGDDFPQPHHWLRKSYSSPAMILPSETSVLSQKLPPSRSHDDRTAAVHHHRINQRKLAWAPTHVDAPRSSFSPVRDLKTKWTNLSENVRDRAESLNSTRLRALDFGRRLRQCHFEAGRVSIPERIDADTDDAG